jgi:hypothetical protein
MAADPIRAGLIPNSFFCGAAIFRRIAPQLDRWLKMVVGGFDIPCHSEQSEESSAIRELPPSGFLVSLGMTNNETE